MPGYGFADVIDHLRATIGAPFADAALAAAGRSGPGTGAAPAAMMPVYAFESDGWSEDVLLITAWLQVRALPGAPVESITYRRLTRMLAEASRDGATSGATSGTVRWAQEVAG